MLCLTYRRKSVHAGVMFGMWFYPAYKLITCYSSKDTTPGQTPASDTGLYLPSGPMGKCAVAHLDGVHSEVCIAARNKGLGEFTSFLADFKQAAPLS